MFNLKTQSRAIALLACLAASLAYGQQYSFKSYGVSEGLLNGNVDSLLQDHQGLLWIGTDTRLFRYDGRKFEDFSWASGLPQTNVNALAEDSSGTVWAGTAVGLYRFQKDRFVRVDENGRAIPVLLGQTLRADPSSGDVIVLTEDRLLRVSAKEPYSVMPAIPGDLLKARGVHGLKSLLTTPDGDLVFGCDDGLCEWAHGVLHRWGKTEGLPEDAWRAVIRTANGDLWLRGERHAAKLPANSMQAEVHDPGPSSEKTLPVLITEDHSGNILVRSGTGLARWSGKSWQQLGPENGIPTSPQLLLTDEEGTIWIGVSGHGLSKWLGYGCWEGWTERQGLGSNVVWAIQRDRHGRMWVATDAGLSIWDEQRRRFQRVALPPGMAGERIQSLVLGDGDDLWAGSGQGHLARMNVVRNKGEQISLQAGDIIRLRVGLNGTVWVSSEQGLFAVDPKTGKGGAAPVRTGFYQDVVVNRDGSLYARRRAGVDYFDGKAWQEVTISDRWKGGQFADLDLTDDGWLWLDGPVPGVTRLRLKGEHVQASESLDGATVHTDDILLISHERNGRMWLGGANGLSYRDEEGGWHPVTQGDGLVWIDIDSKAFWEDPDGSIWFGTTEGLAHFQAQNVSRQRRPLQLRLAQATLGHQVLAGRTGWQIPWSPKSLQFTFRVRSLRNEQSTRVRYRMADLDKEWNESSDGRVEFSQLGAGRYALQVYGIDVTSGRKTPVETVNFELQPPWWQTPEMWALEIVALGVAVWLLLRWRTASMARRQAQLEEIVRERTKEAEQASHLKSQFLATMSHEIRTPLNGVIGMTEVLRRTNLDAEQLEYLDTIQGSGESLLSLVNDILDFSKIEAGRLVLDPVRFQPSRLLNECLAMVRVNAQKKNVDLHLEVAMPMPALTGDALRLKQVLLNLLSNAVKFTGPGGRVVLKARTQMNPDAPERVHLAIEVQDSGIGITEEQKGRLFQSFSQADASTTRRYGGTGLGLAICRQLVSLMDGEIGVNSVPGEGSTFYFHVELPLSECQDEAETAAKAKEAEEALSLHVLVADDNAVNRKLAGNLLQRFGCTVEFAVNGIEALQLAGEKAFDIILMDCQMPEMDGLEATRQIRQGSGSNVKTPIVALTANASNSGRDECLAAGMNDFLAKPFAPRALYDLAAAWSAKRERTAPSEFEGEVLQLSSALDENSHRLTGLPVS